MAKKSKKAKKRSRAAKSTSETDASFVKKPRSFALKPAVIPDADPAQIPELKATSIDLDKSVSNPSALLKNKLNNLAIKVAKADIIESTLANNTQTKLIDSKDQIIKDLMDKISKLIKENKTLLEQLSTLKESTEKLKSGLFCAVCLNYYHVPHNIECGHTFCFSCIRNWFGKLVATEEKLFCPLCRVTVEKVPSFVRTLHNHILETLELENEKHSELISSIKHQLECFENEAEKWQGIFPDCGFRTTIWDGDDDVARCTTCNWEVVGKHCANCGAAYSGELESEKSDSDTSESGESLSQSSGSDSDEEHEGKAQDDSDSTHDSFVCEDDVVEYESDCSSKGTASLDTIDPDKLNLPNHVVIQSDTEHDSEHNGSSLSVQKPRARQLVVSDSD